MSTVHCQLQYNSYPADVMMIMAYISLQFRKLTLLKGCQSSVEISFAVNRRFGERLSACVVKKTLLLHGKSLWEVRRMTRDLPWHIQTIPPPFYRKEGFKPKTRRLTTAAQLQIAEAGIWDCDQHTSQLDFMWLWLKKTVSK